MKYSIDKIVFSPANINLDLCPVKKNTGQETYILGAFNPGLTKLPNSNLLLMVRIAEALKEPIKHNQFNLIRWNSKTGYVIDKYPVRGFDTSDPRKYRFLEYNHTKVYGLTSFSWLLPVEFSSDGLRLIKIHYDKIIEPQKNYQEYGIEDARITKIGEKYYMTNCSVSSERHSTTLYSSDDGLNYNLEGIILDHQNKDMVLFPEKIGGKYYALTRPLGDLYFATGLDNKYNPGPSINMAESPDLLHWKPIDFPFIRALKGTKLSMKLGAGSPPIKTKNGWLILFHGVEKQGTVGKYRTFHALLDLKNPWIIKHIDEQNPILEANEKLTMNMQDLIYVNDIVFTTGIEEFKNLYVVASGEVDLCCRITHISKSIFR